MSDRFYLEMKIGGDPKGSRARLMELIDNAGFENVVEDEHLNLNGGEFKWDDLDELKEFCRRIGVPYEVHGEAKYDYEGTMLWWRPGMVDEKESFCLQSGEQSFSLSELLSAVECDMSLEDYLSKNVAPYMDEFVFEEPE